MRYLFEEYAFDTDRRELQRGADVIPVAPQVFDLLDFLIRNRERVVSKGDLVDAIWKGRAVSDAALTTRLNVARSAIGDSGEQQRLIKTLPRKGFRFVGSVLEAQEPGYAAVTGDRLERPNPALRLPEEPSIAILPFINLSSDPDQDYFADGIVDDITTALSRFKFLFVIASSLSYKGRAVDIEQVGRELGVRYILKGGIRKAAEKVRITGQLIDVESGTHLWADRFEGDLGDIFALQDRMTEAVVFAIAPKMLQNEIDLAVRRSNNLSAYDLCLRASFYSRLWTQSGLAEALRLASCALEIDPRSNFAATLAADCHLGNALQGWGTDSKSETAEGLRLLRLAVSIDRNDYRALSLLGRTTAAVLGDFDAAKEMVDRAVALNPNSYGARQQRGWTYQIAGQPDEAIQAFERAVRISPFDPMLFSTFAGMSAAFISLGRYDEAVAAARKALRSNQTFAITHRCLAAALAQLGRDAEAREAGVRLLELQPNFRISKWLGRLGFWPAERLVDGLRKAGLPE